MLEEPAADCPIGWPRVRERLILALEEPRFESMEGHAAPDNTAWCEDVISVAQRTSRRMQNRNRPMIVRHAGTDHGRLLRRVRRRLIAISSVSVPGIFNRHPDVNAGKGVSLPGLFATVLLASWPNLGHGRQASPMQVIEELAWKCGRGKGEGIISPGMTCTYA